MTAIAAAVSTVDTSLTRVTTGGENVQIELPLNLPISANKAQYDGKVIIFKIPKLF